jgi:hypothetical protein
LVTPSEPPASVSPFPSFQLTKPPPLHPPPPPHCPLPAPAVCHAEDVGGQGRQLGEGAVNPGVSGQGQLGWVDG